VEWIYIIFWGCIYIVYSVQKLSRDLADDFNLHYDTVYML
jgi:hypothetical protein